MHLSPSTGRKPVSKTAPSIELHPRSRVPQWLLLAVLSLLPLSHLMRTHPKKPTGIVYAKILSGVIGSSDLAHFHASRLHSHGSCKVRPFVLASLIPVRDACSRTCSPVHLSRLSSEHRHTTLCNTPYLYLIILISASESAGFSHSSIACACLRLRVFERRVFHGILQE